MIKTTYLKELRQKDYTQVLLNICTFAKQEDLETLQLKTIFDVFEQKVKVLDSSTSKETTKEETKIVEETDLARDRTFTAITSVIRAYFLSPDDAQAGRARKLIDEIEKYGKKITKQSHKSETTSIRNIINDINQSEKLKGTISELHLEEWLTLLGKQNEEFEKIYNARTEKMSEEETGKSKIARAEAQESFEHFAKAIGAYAFVRGEAPYKSLADKINTEIAQALSNIRKKRKQEDKDVR
ncbi:hypothetical protein CAPN001_10440 [Capnocytophaga stomatis]|uniref:DUF6261 family protein n=1 Tax=Capnocytophaga stomatis TaxID=1848904 RepID=UPI0019511CF4|nr:DUF6261 family protein [Capnocytophaga stomatis]GIJ96475.1 hypothetical protein CAPN001_10440 [Capnocytophaga stomatis]